MHRRFSIAAALLLGWLIPGVVHAGCEKDTDCKGDRICEDSVCVNPSPPADAEEGAEETDAEGAEETPAESEVPEETPAVPTDPEDWWKKAARETEVPALQELFDESPRPIRKQKNGAGTLVYKRAVPLVVADIHDTTKVWGGKMQQDVHFLGISKVHTTTTMENIGPETGGITYCPINCARITDIFAAQASGSQVPEINIVYDGPIKDWAGKAADNVSGYVRRVGKQYQAICSFPLAVNHAPANAWLDPEKVTLVKDAVITELKRYCGD